MRLFKNAKENATEGEISSETMEMIKSLPTFDPCAKGMHSRASRYSKCSRCGQ
jgi:hypothetical protein